MADPFLGQPIPFHREFVALAGSINAALMLSVAINTQRAHEDRWWCETREQWEVETGLTRREQDSARARLRALGFWEEKRVGIPAKSHYHVDLNALYAMLGGAETVAR